MNKKNLFLITMLVIFLGMIFFVQMCTSPGEPEVVTTPDIANCLYHISLGEEWLCDGAVKDHFVSKDKKYCLEGTTTNCVAEFGIWYYWDASLSDTECSMYSTSNYFEFGGTLYANADYLLKDNAVYTVAYDADAYFKIDDAIYANDYYFLHNGDPYLKSDEGCVDAYGAGYYWDGEECYIPTNQEMLEWEGITNLLTTSTNQFQIITYDYEIEGQFCVDVNVPTDASYIHFNPYATGFSNGYNAYLIQNGVKTEITLDAGYDYDEGEPNIALILEWNAYEKFGTDIPEGRIAVEITDINSKIWD